MNDAATVSFSTSRNFIEDTRSVLFFARRGERTLRCYLTWEALVTCLGADAAAAAVEAEALQAYDRHAAAVHKVACRLICDGMTAQGGVVISAVDLLRREPGARTDAGMLIRLLGDQLKKTLDRRIQVRVDCETALPCCRAAHAELAAMLVELVTNARDAMPDGGTLSLEARAVPDGVAIVVGDDGAGMDEIVCQWAKEPGFTTKSTPRGGGFGLARVAQFAGDNDGELSIRSALGEGTQVTLRLPAA